MTNQSGKIHSTIAFSFLHKHLQDLEGSNSQIFLRGEIKQICIQIFLFLLKNNGKVHQRIFNQLKLIQENLTLIFNPHKKQNHSNYKSVYLLYLILIIWGDIKICLVIQFKKINQENYHSIKDLILLIHLNIKVPLEIIAQTILIIKKINLIFLQFKTPFLPLKSMKKVK